MYATYLSATHWTNPLFIALLSFSHHSLINPNKNVKGVVSMITLLSAAKFLIVEKNITFVKGVSRRPIVPFTKAVKDDIKIDSQVSSVFLFILQQSHCLINKIAHQGYMWSSLYTNTHYFELNSSVAFVWKPVFNAVGIAHCSIYYTLFEIKREAWNMCGWLCQN